MSSKDEDSSDSDTEESTHASHETPESTSHQDLGIVCVEVAMDNGYVCLEGSRLGVAKQTLQQKYPAYEGYDESHVQLSQVNKGHAVWRRAFIQIPQKAMLLQSYFPPPLPRGTIHLPYYLHKKMFGGSSEHQANKHSGQVEAEGHKPNVLVCDGVDSQVAHQLEGIFHSACLCILYCLGIEVALKMWVRNFRFDKHWHESFDFTIIFLSLFFEVVFPWATGLFSFVSDDVIVSADSGAVFILLLRLWRMLQVSHSIFLVAHKPYHRMAKIRTDLKNARARIKELEGDAGEEADAGAGSKASSRGNNDQSLLERARHHVPHILLTGSTKSDSARSDPDVQ